MAEFEDDVVTLAATAGLGTFGTDIFVSPSAKIPVGAGPYTQVIDTGGATPERTHNSVVVPAYIRPSAQIVVTALSHAVAKAQARALYLALVGVRNQSVSGVWYREINPLQEPFDLPNDENGRARVAFNVTAIRRPS